MDTKEFFDIIWSNEGYRCLAVQEPGKGLRQIWGKDNDWAANVVRELDARGYTVYHACSTFHEKSRNQGTVQAVRSFWVDVDVGEGKPYASPRDAARGVLQFAQSIGWPQPYLISSGRGVHGYWPFDAAVDGATWKEAADRLKAAALQRGFFADPSRTADHASILRPVGSTNRKGQSRPVKLVAAGAVCSFADLVSKLPAAEAKLTGVASAVFGKASNDDLTAGVEYAPRFSAQLGEHCAVARLVRDTRGNVDQPTWYHVLGLLAFCEDADVAHDWSNGHPEYNPGETARKLQQASRFAPTTCATLGADQPALCATCPHKGKIKTPLSLATKAHGLSMQTVAAAAPHTPPPWSTPDFPYRVARDKNLGKDTIQVFNPSIAGQSFDDAVKDDTNWQTMCGQIFYPISRMMVDGVSMVEFEMKLAGGGFRRFFIKGSTIGKGKDGVLSVLGENEIVVLGVGVNRMDGLLRQWMDKLTDSAKLIEGHQSFGWTEDNRFVIGEDIMVAGGKSLRAVISGSAKSKIKALEPKGDLATWVKTIDRAYNAPGQEGYQFLVALGFAAPLLKMLKQVSGVTVYAHSEDSGVGKTTATRAALSAWGNWDELQLSEGKATVGSLWALMGCYNSLPIVFDELTNMDPRMASELVFSVSSGRSKQRLHSTGDLREPPPGWNTIMLASGNNLLSEKLAQHRANPEAEISRLFEFTLTATSHLTPNEANELFPLLLDHYGHAGRAFIRAVVDDYDRVSEMLRNTQAALNKVGGITQKERYWSALMASVIVATAICRNLGLLKFDIAGLRLWMLERLKENRQERTTAVGDPTETIGKMLADLWQGMLVTIGEGDARKNTQASVIEKPRGRMTGRVVLPAPQDANAKAALLISEDAVRQWATSKGVSAREIFRTAVTVGWADPVKVRYNLGRGTLEYGALTSYVTCWKLDPEKVAGAGGGPVAQRLSTITGGQSAARKQ